MKTAEIEVEELVEVACQLPPLPRTTSRIISLLGDPVFEVSELIKVISLDSALTSQLLRLANSATHSRSRPATSVGDAIMRLGSGTILTIAVAASTKPDAYTDLTTFGLTADDYWKHCVGSVAVSEELNARRIALFGPGFTTAALLHDFGKLILSKQITPQRAQQLTEFRASHPGHCLIDAERAVLGVDHAVAGAIVARFWNLPEVIAAAIERHHSPVDWGDDLTNGVILANQIAQENAGRTEFALETAENLADAMLALGIDDRTYEAVALASQLRFENLIELFA